MHNLEVNKMNPRKTWKLTDHLSSRKYGRVRNMQACMQAFEPARRKKATGLDKISCKLLSGSLSKSGPLDFGTKTNFLSFFVSEKGLAHIYKKAIYYFPVSYFCFATSQNCILAELRLPTVIRKVKFTDFMKRATSPKMQLAEFRFHKNFKVHSLL